MLLLAEAQRRGELFGPSYSPSKIRWWLTMIDRPLPDGGPYSHFGVLLAMLRGRSAEDTESLSYCYQRVVHDSARSASGLWCVCLLEDSPSAGEGRGSRGGDGMATLLCVKADLEHAADLLPISWSTTQRTFETQKRAGLWQARYGRYLKNKGVREIDRWLEPRDPETRKPKAAALSNYLMALSLGGARTECGWPGVQTPAFNLSVFEHHRQRAELLAA